MLKKILIANRGEIACRIFRTAKAMGVATVAVYSDADAKALHVRQADEAVYIGPSPATESYLRGDRIIAAAKATGAEAIHPGYGFLAENADFADAVTKAGLKFIGPSANAMRALGGKAAAKEIAIKAGVPVVPGYQGEKQDAKTLAAEAKKIGYPVMIKAVAGGGGRGMRRVEKASDFTELLASAQREAESAFGNAQVLLEKVVERPRHIEVQVFGDAHGNVVHMFERDCSLQRRNQKVIEEAPAPGMSAELRQKMCAAAVGLAKHVGYEGAGTVEFLVEGGSLASDATWYFIEMNTRLQVEHPVTEEITGLDLVEWQLRVASGETLPLAQSAIKMTGHAIEVRLCAEDPAKEFLPSVGRFYGVRLTPMRNCRLETGIDCNGEISPFYDSMFAKLIVTGERETALDQMSAWLQRIEIFGLKTNIAFLSALVGHPDVRQGRMDTGLIGRDLGKLVAGGVDFELIADAGLALLQNQSWVGQNLSDRPVTPWDNKNSFQLGAPRRIRFPVVADDEPHELVITSVDDDGHVTVEVGDAKTRRRMDGINQGSSILVEDDTVYARRNAGHLTVRRPTYDVSAVDDGNAGDAVRAPINGKVARLFVVEGETVEKGQRIAVVEAMKMEHVLTAPRAGSIGKVAVEEGAQVNQGAMIVALTPEQP